MYQKIHPYTRYLTKRTEAKRRYLLKGYLREPETILTGENGTGVMAAITMISPPHLFIYLAYFLK